MPRDDDDDAVVRATEGTKATTDEGDARRETRDAMASFMLAKYVNVELGVVLWRWDVVVFSSPPLRSLPPSRGGSRDDTCVW
jgi:hypothetical protein